MPSDSTTGESLCRKALRLPHAAQSHDNGFRRSGLPQLTSHAGAHTFGSCVQIPRFTELSAMRFFTFLTAVLCSSAIVALAQDVPPLPPPGQLDPTRAIQNPVLFSSFHQPLPEQYIWTHDAENLTRAQRDEPRYFRVHLHLDSAPEAATLYLAGPRRSALPRLHARLRRRPHPPAARRRQHHCHRSRSRPQTRRETNPRPDWRHRSAHPHHRSRMETLPPRSREMARRAIR